MIGEEPIRGFLAVETIGKGWFEYDLERIRVQHVSDGVDQSVSSGTSAVRGSAGDGARLRSVSIAAGLSGAVVDGRRWVPYGADGCDPALAGEFGRLTGDKVHELRIRLSIWRALADGSVKKCCSGISNTSGFYTVFQRYMAA
jgi:hypothetical protein